MGLDPPPQVWAAFSVLCFQRTGLPLLRVLRHPALSGSPHLVGSMRVAPVLFTFETLTQA